MPIKVTGLTYIYGKKTPTAFKALDDINLELNDHIFAAIVGETGSGKSTLVQHFNGLLIPTEGTVLVDDFLIVNKKRKNKNMRDLRKKIGLVFQFPEYQLYESTVIKDVMVGPKNFKASDDEAREIAQKALAEVGIGEDFYERSPFDLSGGEKRRIAIAGILALNPDVLVLDEPVAGLDPEGVEEIMGLLTRMYEAGKSIILISHNMDLVLQYAHEVYALHQGKLIYEGTPKELFSHITDDMALEIPTLYTMINKLNEHGMHLDPLEVSTVEELVSAIMKERGLG
ncbi:MAG: energy-coupling factor transporter ATPase [Coprobacillus sp.]|nr:energy-coupling factor transporter ATPase [Coprobacillus sp.]